MKCIYSLLFFIIPLFLVSQNNTMLPPKGLAMDQKLNELSSQLKTAIRSKDKTALLTLLADDITFTYDGENTKQAFNKYWFSEENEKKFWLIVEKLIAYPGDYELIDKKSKKYDQNSFVIPYIFNYPEKGEDDDFNIHFIMGDHVNVRSEPNLQSRVVAQLNYNLVHTQQDNDGNDITSGTVLPNFPEWYKIETPDKKIQGWVNFKFVHSVYGERIIISRKKNAWIVSVFISGE